MQGNEGAKEGVYKGTQLTERAKLTKQKGKLASKKCRDNSEEVTPVPIPNTVVKLFIADDTWLEATWESRKPRLFLLQKRWSIYDHLFMLYLIDDYINC